MPEISIESAITKNWTALPKQEKFIELPFDIFEGLYGGAAGGGKSELLILLPLIYNFHEHPKFKGLILRRTFPELEAEVILRSKEWYPSTGGIYNESKHRWDWANGARIQFGHVAREQDVRNYDTAQFNYFAPDEATSLTEFIYSFIAFSRVRSATPDLPSIVRGATNPGNVGHTYFRRRFVDPFREGGRVIQDYDKKGKKLPPRYYIQSLPTDNPILIKNNPNYLAQLSMLPEAERRAKLGDWYIFKGQVFNEFRLEPLNGEPENARHVIEPFVIPDWWPKIVAIDWGYQAWTYICWAALAPNGQIIIYKEYAEKEKKTLEWIEDFINITGHERSQIKEISMCHSSTQQRGEPLTILSQLQVAIRNAKFECKIGLGDKNRLAGKLLIHEFLRWNKSRGIQAFHDEPFSLEKASYIYRNYGDKAYSEYVGMFGENTNDSVLPKMQIFNTCEVLIETIPKCVYNDQSGDATKQTAVEDVKEFDGDDPYDCLRILLRSIKAYQLENVKQLEVLKNANIALNVLQTSGDQTSFYRKMEHLESQKKSAFAVRRRKSFRR